jgi:hypothetical protein
MYKVLIQIIYLYTFSWCGDQLYNNVLPLNISVIDPSCRLTPGHWPVYKFVFQPSAQFSFIREISAPIRFATGPTRVRGAQWGRHNYLVAMLPNGYRLGYYSCSGQQVSSLSYKTFPCFLPYSPASPRQHSRSLFRDTRPYFVFTYLHVFWNGSSSSTREGVWLRLVTPPPLQRSDSEGCNSHLLTRPLAVPTRTFLSHQFPDHHFIEFSVRMTVYAISHA